MAWTYCHSCDRGVDTPKIREVLTDNYRCHCGQQLDSLRTKDEVLVELLDRLEAIEAKLGLQAE